MRLEATARGNVVTVAECRPPWQGEPGEWTRMNIAQLRYEPTSTRWTLYWADGNSRWCSPTPPSLRPARRSGSGTGCSAAA